MSQEEWEPFLADIAANGLKHPITTWHDMIVDGRHRQRACEATGVAPRYDVLDASWDEGRVLLHCASLHKRRNMTADQRAMYGARIKGHYEQITAARQVSGKGEDGSGGRGNKKTLPSTQGKVTEEPDRHARESSALAAQAAGAPSRYSVEQATLVMRASPDLASRVERGEIKLAQAVRVAKAPEEQRAAIAAQLATNTRSEEEGDSWGTPREWIGLARTIMGGIDLDPATNAGAQKIVQAKTYYTREDNGLEREWHGRVWMNPPYSQPLVTQFIQKLFAEGAAGRVTEALVLVNNATDTTFGQTLLINADAVLFPKGRISFCTPGTEIALQGTRQGQMLVYLGPNVDRFVSACADRGAVLRAR
jgi:ParB family chromosome partitioning protein